jgi:hypothetical protein
MHPVRIPNEQKTTDRVKIAGKLGWIDLWRQAFRHGEEMGMRLAY